MKIFAYSDIHDNWKFAKSIPKDGVDLILLAGDITNHGWTIIAEEKLKKIASETKARVAFVTGNHDFKVEKPWPVKFRNPPQQVSEPFYDRYEYSGLPIYNIEELVFLTKEELKIAGMNLTVAYNAPSLVNVWVNMTIHEGEEELYYKKFPKVDIVVSHSPPCGILDKTYSGHSIGSEQLLKYVKEKQPSLVICGHVHENSGCEWVEKTLVVNAAQKGFLIEYDETSKSVLSVEELG